VFWADSADPVFDRKQIPQIQFREISATAKGSSAMAMTVNLPLAYNPKPICDFLRNLRETTRFGAFVVNKSRLSVGWSTQAESNFKT
jgi:hypothetical protein